MPAEVLTDRLLLRQWREDDLDPFARIVANPEVTRFLGDGSPATRHDAWRGLMMFAGAWRLQGFANWAVELRHTGEFIGRVGPWYPPAWPALEIGWMIDPVHQRRGYATEAGRAALRLAWEHLEPARVVSLIRPDNAASAAVARKLGGELRETMNFFDSPADVYEYARPSPAAPG